MKRTWPIVLFFFALSPAFSQSPSKIIENFEQYKPNTFPTFFKTWPFQRGKAKEVYKIAEENKNKFLSASDDQNYSVQIFKEFDWKTESYPVLKWRWRAHILPEGAKESDPEKNDSACGVYVLFGKTSGKALKFTWSTTLPEGTIYEKRPHEVVMKILDSGSKHLNQWRSHTVNIPSIYKELFKEEMNRQPTGIAILTDANAVQKKAACDYDDFEISAVP